MAINNARDKVSSVGSFESTFHSFPWLDTPLGPSAHWPSVLKALTQLILDAAQPMFIVWGASRTLLHNAPYCLLLGRKHPGALGRSFFEVWPEARDSIEPLVERAFVGEAIQMDDIAVQLDRAEGPSEAHFAFSYTPIRDDTARIAGLFCACTETTASVLGKQQGDRDRERLRQMFEQGPSFMAMLSGSTHRFEFANAAYRQLVGQRELIGRTVAEALPDAVAQGYLDLLDGVFRSGQAFSSRGARYAAEPISGGPIHERFVDFIFHPITDADGAVSAIFVEGSDVTERTRAEAALRESEAHLKDVNATLERRIEQRTAQLLAREALIRIFYEHSSECHAVLVEAEEGRFRYEEINPATLRLYGRSREEVIGRTTEEVLGEEPAYELNEHLKTCLKLESPYQYERVQGSGIVEAVATPVPQDSGGPRRLVVSARDVTERRRLEQQLRQSQKMEAVGQLTGGLAHDFNNLLAGIMGSLDVLKVRLAQGRIDDLGRYVAAAHGAAKRSAALTHRLLAFARRQTLDAKPTDVNRLISDLEELLRRTVGPEITVAFVGAVGLWRTLVDANQLESALLNLCINARDAMPDGGKLTIETANRWLDQRAARERDLAPGQYLSLCVSDTGTGMAPEVVARAFDPFFTTKPLGQGTGLGLSMVYGFASQSGGQVRIYSELGQGSTVCIYLPRYHGKEEGGDIADVSANTPRAEEGETVLIVDDEPTLRMLMSETLQELGYATIEAAEGVSALKLLQSSRRIDALVTDVGLPGGINGRQLADAGRALRAHLKVLFVTGYAENAVVGHGHLDPGFHILTKPFPMETFGSRVRDILENKHGVSASAAP
jgi:PAS domain S-box-containing protein